ncbi:MAG: hypothetical protein IT321_17240 [Anaerolineae bacterium]|nr:hypothetical protein [Anaerolineae bacterium]
MSRRHKMSLQRMHGSFPPANSADKLQFVQFPKHEIFGGAYFSFMAGNEAEGRAKDVYGTTHYDPDNVFLFTFLLVGEHAEAKA